MKTSGSSKSPNAKMWYFNEIQLGVLDISFVINSVWAGCAHA